MGTNLKVIELLLAGLATLTVAGIVFWKYRKRRIARIFALNVFAYAGYCWFLAGVAASRQVEVADLWYRFLMPSAYLLVASFFHFCMAFTRTENRLSRGYLKAAYACVAVLTAIRVFNLDQSGMTFHEVQGWFPIQNALYKNFYVPFVLVTVLGGLGLVINRMIRTKLASQRNQLGYFFVGIFLALFFDAFNLVPALSFLAPFGPFAYAGILAFAITRHRLFGLSGVISKGTIAAGLIFGLAVAVVAVILKVQEMVVFREMGFGPFAIISSALLIATALPLLWNPLSELVNRLFGIRVLSPEQRLLAYSSLLSKHVRFNDYLAAVLGKLGGDMGLAQPRALFKDRVSGGFSAPYDIEKGHELGAKSALVEALAARDTPLDVEDLLSVGEDESHEGLDAARRKAVADDMAAASAAVAVPLNGENGLEGILLLGSKASSAIFSARELDFLQALGTQIASAFENWKLHSQIQQSERLSTLGTLSASLAHELRNPLTSISTFVQMLPAKFADEAFREKFGRIVGLEISKLTHLTEQLLNFSRPSSSARGAVNLWQLADRVRQLLRYQFAKKNVALEIGGLEQEAWVSGNDAELSQVLVNLLLNALQASESGSRVLVLAGGENSRATLRVVDHGSGMQPEQLRRIFEPFFTTKEAGTGLGLPTCQRIVEQHGGSIEVSSSPGEGSVFILSFPQSKILQLREAAAA